MSHAGQAHEFFNALLGGTGEQLAGCYFTVTAIVPSESEPQTRWVPAGVDRLASAVSDAAARDGVTGVYIGMGLTRGRASGAGRLTVGSTVGMAFLWVDIDILGAGHDEKNPKPYAPDLETALAIAHCLGIAPTVIIHTGHGIQAFYRLAEPWIFGAVDADDDGAPIIDEARVDADRAAAKDLAWSFVTSLRIRARQLGGWYVDPTGDLARLMRVPGTRNRKLAGEDLPVDIIEATDYRYDREQIEAVLAPRALLDPYRTTNAATSSLVGVDLAGLWAQVQGSKDHIPPWLATVLDSGWDDALARIWSGEDDKRYHNDDSAIDIALVAAILRLELGADKAAQAVMARRVRIGRKVEKVDPSERVDYLDRTITRVAGRIAARAAIAEASDALIDAALEPEPDDDPDDPTPGGAPLDSGPPDPTQVVGGEPTYKENAASLHSPPDNASPPPVAQLRRPELSPAPEVAHADAPRAPRQGIDPATPGPPDQKERNLGVQLAAQMGLPAGVAIWAVGMRRMEKCDEIRVWMRRGPESIVRGGTWRVNTIASTRWHPKSEWETGVKVAGIVWRDLHLEIEPVAARAWRDDGRTRLYELARRMEEGTPAETVRQSVVGLLRRAAGSSLFSTSVVSRDPWVSESGVWLALDAIRSAISQSGFAVQSAHKLMDTLDELGCKVQTGMEIEEDTRTVFDELPWVLLGEGLFLGQLREHVGMRAADRDVQEARSGLRMIGPA